MQSSSSRQSSPRTFKVDHEDENTHLETAVAMQSNGNLYNHPSYDNSRFSQPSMIHQYAPESSYDRLSGVPSQQSTPAEGDPENYGNTYKYAASKMQPTQPHVPSQGAQFPMPAIRSVHDATGQSCPPGGKPRVSTTIWEDEGSLCFQVEAHQVTVARREDNDMINGTKLLNVAQMSRGKRDGILKNEANRSVIKIGSMHLKGVWIPFARALELANKYYITDLLYPLFVKDIRNFLYHPTNYARTMAVMAAANRRQGLQGQGAMPGDTLQNDRPQLDRSLSMPTPLDRSLSLLTPPSSASTNGDYWTTGAHQSIPMSDTHARAHSLPGTPATTPPAAAYFQGLQPHQQQAYMGPFTEPRLQTSSNLYGQQPDMQRSYQHSRNTSLMSYQDEDMSNASSSHSMLHEPYVAAPSQHKQLSDQNRYANQAYHSGHNAPSSAHREAAPLSNIPADVSGLNVNTRPQSGSSGHGRTHSRSHSRGSLKMYNTPNLTTQLSRQALRTPNASPHRTHTRQGSREVQAQSNQASLWVQQQQQLSYSTPQQASRGHVRQMSGQSSQLPQIYEETPSCRMAYQLHGQQRLPEQYPRLSEHSRLYSAPNGSPVREPYAVELGNSPLTGKKRRDRINADADVFYAHSQSADTSAYADRQESLTPPPITEQKLEYEDSPKRRKTGTHSRIGSFY